MDIDQFIQEDILVFLDKQLEEPVGTGQRVIDDEMYLSRDYEEEMLDALDRNNIVGAKKILHDLKDRFDEVPVGTPEKAKMKFLLQSLYDKFREHIEAATTFSEMDTALTKMARGESPELEKPHKKDGSEEIPGKDPEQPPRLPKKHDERKQRLVEHAKDMLDDAETHLATERIKDAAMSYRDARKDILDMESSVPSGLARRFKDVHERIRDAMRELKSERRAEIDKDLLLQLEREKHALDRQLERHDMKGAMLTYRKMRVLAQQISSQRLAERAAEKLIRIHEIIRSLTTHGQEAP